MRETKVLGVRFTGEEMKVYRRIEGLTEGKFFVSDVARALINRGLEHIDNPGPLIKEKGDHQDKTEKSVSKVVSKDKPLKEFSKKREEKEGKGNLLMGFLALVGLVISASLLVDKYRKKAANANPGEQTKEEPEPDDGRWWERGLI